MRSPHHRRIEREGGGGGGGDMRLVAQQIVERGLINCRITSRVGSPKSRRKTKKQKADLSEITDWVLRREGAAAL